MPVFDCTLIDTIFYPVRKLYRRYKNSKQPLLEINLKVLAGPKRSVALGVYAVVATADTVALAVVVLLIALS